jgi:hypothetical protein
MDATPRGSLARLDLNLIPRRMTFEIFPIIGDFEIAAT